MTATAADIAAQSFRRLQLRTLHVLGGLLAVSLGLRLLFASPATEGTLIAGRLLLVVLGAVVTVVPTAANARQYGIALVCFLKVVNFVKSLTAPVGEVAILTATFGMHRLLPFAVAVFGGTRACIGMSLLASLDTVGVPVWRRVQAADGPLAWPTWDEVSRWYTEDREAAVVWTELNLIWIATGIAVAIVQTHHQAMAQLVDALVSRQRFISNMNHEIRTPLVGVVGVTDILLATAGVKGDLREQLGIIHSSGKALLTLVNNILDISRMDAHMLTVNRQPEDIRSITRTVTDTFVAIAAAKGIAFSAIIGDKVPTLLLLDATRIQQLIGNLLGNAFKFTLSGTVTVTVGVTNDASDAALEALLRSDSDCPGELPEASAGVTYNATKERLGVTKEATDGWSPPAWLASHLPWLPTALTRRHPQHRQPSRLMLWFRVADTGVGVDAAALRRIFQPFQQADNSTTRQFGGSGLGLAICLEVTDLLGGTLLVQSRVGIGSTFLVALPCEVAPTSAAGADAAAAAAASGAGSWTTRVLASPYSEAGRAAAALQPRPRPVVLVVDDNRINAVVVARQLEQLGCDAITASDGAQAVALVKTALARLAPALRGAAAAYALPPTSAANSWEWHAAAGASDLASSTASAPQEQPPDDSDARTARRALHRRQTAHPESLGGVTERVVAGPHAGRADEPGGRLPILVLMDLDMPVMDGLVATRAIRELERERFGPVSRIPILALTAGDRSSVETACSAAGMDGFVSKPTTVDTLRATLQRYIGIGFAG